MRFVPTTAERAPSTRRTAGRIALALAAVLAVAWFALLRPPVLGGSTAYVVVSGSSMDPTLRDNDLVVVRERSSYAVGDVVAFRLGADESGVDEAVIHRIVGGSATEGYVTRGDNRDADDSWRVFPDDILGRQLVRVPRVGLVLGWLGQPLVIGALVGAAIASVYWIVHLHATRSTRRQPATTLQPTLTDANPGGHEFVAARIKKRYERADATDKVAIRQVVFQQAAAYKAEDPDFDTAAFLRACGAHAYERHQR